MTTVLLIDDDIKLIEPIQRQLTMQGFKVSIAHDGRTGLGLAMVEKPDVIVLDIMLPEMDGWQVCQEIRRFSQVPIIMLTARDQQVDRIHGLELGADDYVGKPFSFQELLARIRSVLRRIQWDQEGANGSKHVEIGSITLDILGHRAYRNGSELTLRNKEYDLLFLLMQNAGRVMEREALFTQVWGVDWFGDMRTLDVHISLLRQKIEDNPSTPRYIQTLRSVGYRFARPEEVAR